MAANAKYGFALESGKRTSMRRAFGFDTHGMRMDAERIARGVGEHHRRLESRHQALVAVGACIGEGIDGFRVLDDSHRCSTARCRKVRRTCHPANSALPSFCNDWWTCMPLPLSPTSGLGMKVAVLP